MARKVSDAKKAKQKESRAKYYEKNKEKMKEKVKEGRVTKKKIVTRAATKSPKSKKRRTELNEAMARLRAKRKEQAKLAEEAEKARKEKNLERTKKSRNKRTAELTPGTGFSTSPRSIKAKQRKVKAMKQKGPKTPAKRAECIEKLVESPSVRPILEEKGLINTKETQDGVLLANAVMADLDVSRKKISEDKSPESVQLAKRGLAMAFGENVKKAKKTGALRKRLSLSKNSAFRYSKLNKSGAWKLAARKVRSDAISPEVQKKVVDYWSGPDASHVTGNKNDVMHIRIGPKEYAEHPKMIMEKRQSDIFRDFCEKNPDIRMHQRTFEKLKPYYVVPASGKDRNSCCCQKCVGLNMSFESSMKFRNKLNKLEGNNYKTYESVSEIIAETMCENPTLKCRERKCKHCGTDKFEVLEEEREDSFENGSIKWNKFEYKEVRTSKGGTKRKLMLIEKETTPAVFMEHFLKSVDEFAHHEFLAKNQHKQHRALLEQLPLNHAIVINDYSLAYTCRYQDEVQTQFFDPEQVQIHVSVIMRHARRDADGDESTEDNPIIITEHFLCVFLVHVK